MSVRVCPTPPRFLAFFLFMPFLLMSATWPAEGRVLHTFTGGNDGGAPEGDLVVHAGALYGTTAGGGTGSCTGGCGTVFQLTRNPDNSWTQTVLYKFTGELDGGSPRAGVTFDAAGNIYGTTVQNGDPTCQCGSVYKLTHSGGRWIETTLYDFTELNGDGALPMSAVVIDRAGNVFGTTFHGGTYNQGTVFELTPSHGSWIETILYSFVLSNSPNGLTYRSGILYGTTNGGGVYGQGIAFRLKSAGVWTFTDIYDFTGGNNGGFPSTSLTFDPAGNLYGTTVGGGADNVGTVFKLTHSKGQRVIAVLHSFTGGLDGGQPMGRVTFDSSGNLYGTTGKGGGYQAGVVFKLTPSSGEWTSTTIHSFTGGRDGGTPLAGVVLKPGGNLFGTTAGGGTSGLGVVFRFHL